jgi:hypothetical protein
LKHRTKALVMLLEPSVRLRHRKLHANALRKPVPVLQLLLLPLQQIRRLQLLLLCLRVQLLMEGLGIFRRRSQVLPAEERA